MNIVSARKPRYGFGQFDPSDVFILPDDTSGGVPSTGIVSPYQTYGSPDNTPQNAPAPSVSVPQPPQSSLPSSQILATFGPYGTMDPTAAAGLPPGPAPRVNVPLSLSNPSSMSLWFSNNMPLVLGLGAAVLLLPGLMGGGKRRR
jgi:hypothetical protein